MFDFPAKKKKKKVDYEALKSPLAHIPGLDIPSIRDLIDLGFQHIVELNGRSPEAMFEEIQKIRPETPADRLHYYRLAVYYSETEQPEKEKLKVWYWAD